MVLICISLIISHTEHFLKIAVDSFDVFVGEMSVQVFVPFLRDFFFFAIVSSSLYISDVNPGSDIYSRSFLPIFRLPCYFFFKESST